MQCQKRKHDGERCRARTVTGKKFCSLHAEPGRAAELGRKGGRRRAVYSLENLKAFSAPTSAADLRGPIAQSIVELRTGTLDPRLANSISYLGACFLRALEMSDLEARLQALEAHAEKEGDGEPQR